MNKLITLFVLLFLASNLKAQEIVIPKDIKLETPEDYKVTEKLVLEGIEWVQNTPLSANSAKRRDVNAFLVKWMSGSPTVSIELFAEITPMKCTECLIAFMGGWTKYSLENNYSEDGVKGALAGVERAIAFYEKNKSMVEKDSGLEKLIKRKNKGELESYVQSIMKK